MLDTYKSLLLQTSQEFPLIGQATLYHRNTRGQPMSFADFPYLAQMYAEMPENGADIRKAVQTGLSELFICLALYHSGWKGKIVAYVLPTFSVRDRFVAGRINKILTLSEGYRKNLPHGKDVGNNRLKRFGTGTMLFLGSNTATDFVEFSADTLIVDELDQCDPSNLAKARDRIRASNDPKLYRLGNPTLPNRGICQLFDKSDQRYWFTKCTACGEWQSLDWFKNFITKDDEGNWVPRDEKARNELKYCEPENLKYEMLPVCINCNQTFHRHGEGEWVSLYPERDRAGYTMARLDVLSESITRLYSEWIFSQGDTNRLSTFYTSVLGMGFEFSGAKITAEMLSACSKGKENDYVGGDEYKEYIVSMGIDVGSVLNFSISIAKEDSNGNAIREGVYIGACRSFDEIKELMLRYHVTTCVIDAMPETRMAQDLRDWAMYENMDVWLCRFHPNARVGNEAYSRKLNWETKEVKVDRTQIMDATFDEIKNQDRIFPKDMAMVLGFYEQMKASVRVLDTERSKITWAEGTAADHYRFADVYDRIAFDLTQMTGSYSTV